MAFTLIEYAKGERDQLKRSVIETFAEEPLLANIPLENIQSNAIEYNRESVLPGIAFRGVNEAYSESVGVWLPQKESLKILGGDSDVDKALVRWFGEGRRASNLYEKVKAARLYFLKMFIDGDESTDPKQFDGLNRRIGTTGDQLIHADGVGTIGEEITENMMQVLGDAIDGGPDMYVMGKATLRQLSYLFKGSTILGFSDPNFFGHKVRTFDGVPIQILDKDNEGNTILDFDETEGSSSGTTASIYAVKFGSGTHLCGIQSGPPETVDKGLLETKNVYRHNVEWYIGMSMYHPRCCARLKGILKQSGVL